MKYRLAAANEEHGNYILTAFLQVTFPTGQYKNGSTNTIVTPTIAYGKGIGSFDVQGTFGVTLPTGNEARIGRTLPWNNAFQYHLYKKLWPAVEVNYTRFMDGPNDGKPRPSSRREFFLAGFTCTSAHLLQQQAGSKSLQLIFIPTTTTKF